MSIAGKSSQLSPLAHWNFFQTIDEDLYAYSRYLEFHESNFPAFSTNLARLYLSIGSEIDVVAKMICKRDIPSSDPANIDQCRKEITKRYPLFPHFWVYVRQVCTIQPWEEWITTPDKNPEWWGDYNKVKHRRDEFFHKANLQNVLCSAAGLLVMLIYWYADLVQTRQLKPQFRTIELHPNLDVHIATGDFRVENWPTDKLPKETLSAIEARLQSSQSKPAGP